MFTFWYSRKRFYHYTASERGWGETPPTGAVPPAPPLGAQATDLLRSLQHDLLDLSLISILHSSIHATLTPRLCAQCRHAKVFIHCEKNYSVDHIIVVIVVAFNSGNLATTVSAQIGFILSL